jgi:hypothetical protein
MSRTKNAHFTYLPVLAEQRTRSLHRALIFDAKKYAVIQRYIKENKGNAIMSRATMTEIANRVFLIAYPHFYTFKNVSLRVKDSHLFDLSRVKCEVEKVKKARTSKRATVENTSAVDASHMIEAPSEAYALTENAFAPSAPLESSVDAIARIENAE